jgi:hypothetical protein
MKIVRVGRWNLALHPPVLAFRGDRKDHITRPNLCQFNGAVGLIFQTTKDVFATTADRRHVMVSTDGGSSWHIAAEHLDVGSYSLFSKPNGEVVVMPYCSVRFGQNDREYGGKRTTLAWRDNALQVHVDTTIARVPFDLARFPASYGAPAERPIATFWGTLQQDIDGAWLMPAYLTLASESVTLDTHPEHGMRGRAKKSTALFRSTDEGRTWDFVSIIAGPKDIHESVSEGPSEAHLFLLADRWRAVFRASALKIISPMFAADSFDRGKTWSKPVPLSRVDGMIDPRGLTMPDGPVVLATGRRGSDIYLADGSSLDFKKVDMVAHHNACLPDATLDTIVWEEFPWFHPNTGHTDVLQIGPKRLLFAYDRIPDGWRYNDTYTAPDEIYTVAVDIE